MSTTRAYVDSECSDGEFPGLAGAGGGTAAASSSELWPPTPTLGMIVGELGFPWADGSREEETAEVRRLAVAAPLPRRRRRFKGHPSFGASGTASPASPLEVDGEREWPPQKLRRRFKSPPGPVQRPAIVDLVAAPTAGPQSLSPLPCAVALRPAARGAGLGALSSELAAFLLSFVDLRTKVVGVRPTSIRLREAMQGRVAWDPLHLDQVSGRAFLRLLKRRDPLGCFAPDVNRTKRIFPAGLFEVRQLEAVLMDPERMEQEVSDTEDDTPRPRPLVIADPLDEVCKRLRYYFTSVRELSISNIEDSRMDYRFVGLRTGNLEDFGFIELVHCSTNPPSYALHARRDAPPRLLDLEAVRAENRERSRTVPSARFDERTIVSEREALYLAEHRNAYKNGDDFHLVHAPYRTVKSHGVRKQYKAVVARLRKRFPQQFLSKADAGSPCRTGGGKSYASYMQSP